MVEQSIVELKSAGLDDQNSARSRVGTITFGNAGFNIYGNAGDGCIRANERGSIPVFYDVDNAEVVYQLVSDAIAKASATG